MVVEAGSEDTVSSAETSHRLDNTVRRPLGAQTDGLRDVGPPLRRSRRTLESRPNPVHTETP